MKDDEDLDKSRNFLANIREEKFKSMKNKRETNNKSNISNQIANLSTATTSHI